MLRLGINFPRTVLCSRKNVVGIELINPKKSVAILVCKLCVGNLGSNTKMYEIMKMQEHTRNKNDKTIQSMKMKKIRRNAYELL